MSNILRLKRKWLLLFAPIAILIIFICRANSFIAEYAFGRFIYRIFAVIVGAVTRWFLFSVAEIIIYVLLVVAIVIPIMFIVHIIKGKGRRVEIAGKGILNVLCAISIVAFLFVVMCGTNYYRYSFKEYLNYDITESDKYDLYNLCVYLADKVNEARAEITTVDENGVMKLNYETYGDFFAEAEEIMSEFAESYPSLQWSTGSVKPVLASKYMSYTDIVGIFIPFTMEANVNVDTVDYNQPSDAMHELAHLRGVMPEDEANYVSYLACINSGRPDFVYSGYMMAYIHASNALFDEDIDLYCQMREMISDEVNADLYANSKYWDQFETPVGEVVSSVSTQINNTYLQVNGQEDGVKSYGMVVDLLLAEYKYITGQEKSQ